MGSVGLASLAVNIGLSQLAQHTARLTDATNENQALDALIPAFDLDIQAVVAAFNSGEASAATCIQALAAIDNNCIAYLKAQVGKTGTAWDGTGTCSKKCTAGCCVYYNNLHSAIYGPSGAPYNGSIAKANGAYGLIPAIQNPASVPSSAWSGHGQCYIPEVFPPSDTSYGNYSRAGYTLTVTAPPPMSVATKILTVSGSGTATKVSASPAPPTVLASNVATAAVATPAEASSLLSSLTNTQLVTIVGLIGGFLLIIQALFGSNSTRVA